MRMARTVTNLLSPHLKPGSNLDPMDFMLYPDDAHSIPDDISAQEKAWMLKLRRTSGPE